MTFVVAVYSLMFLFVIRPSSTQNAASTTLVPRIRTTPPYANETVMLDCPFDTDQGGSDTCGFVNGDPPGQMKWLLWKGRNPGVFTGPGWDHSYGDGYYMLFDANVKFTAGMQPGALARMTSVEITTADHEPCADISFWYNAYGFHLGKLTASYRRAPYNIKNNWTSFFEKNGPDQTQGWRLASFSLVDIITFKLQFEATLGDGPQGNYALDDIQVMAVPCPTSPLKLGMTQAIFYMTTTGKPEKVPIELWVIALIVIIVVSAVVAAGVIVFLYFRHKKLQVIKERQDAEKAEQLRREIEQYGVIKARLDRTISGRIMQMQEAEINAGRPVDRPALDRRLITNSARVRPETAMTALHEGGYVGDSDDVIQNVDGADNERSDVIFSIINNSYSTQPDAERSEAVFSILNSSNNNRATQPPVRDSSLTLGERTKSQVARDVHHIEEIPLAGAKPLGVRLPPLAPGTIASPGQSPPGSEQKQSAPSSARSVRFEDQPTSASSSNKGAEKPKRKGSEQLDWLKDD